MCRSIKPLYNFEPAATSAEIDAAALQFVRKLSGFQKPSLANEAVFNRAVHDIAHVAQYLLSDLVTAAPPKDRQEDELKARARFAKRQLASGSAQV